MSQTSYTRDQIAAFMGMKCDSRFDTVESPVALGNIPIGYGHVYGDVDGNTCRLPTTTKSVLLFNADFVTSNTIDMDINGTSIAQVTFSGDHDTTAGLLAASMTAVEGVTAVLDTTDANNRTIIVTSEDAAVLITSVVVALGASQAGHTVTTNTNDKFRGLALHTHTLIQDETTGEVKYVANDIVNSLIDGCGYGWCEDVVTEKDPVYLRFEANGAGKVVGYFLKTADTNKAMLLDGVQFGSRTTAAGLVKIKLNLPG
jgi:hypothetical protein